VTLQTQNLKDELLEILLTDKMEVARPIRNDLNNISLLFNRQIRQVSDNGVKRMLKIGNVVMLVRE